MLKKFGLLSPIGTGKIDVGPVANIYLRSHTKDEEGRILVMPNVMSAGELEEQIDALIADLRSLKQTGRAFFAKNQRSKAS